MISGLIEALSVITGSYLSLTDLYWSLVLGAAFVATLVLVMGLWPTIHRYMMRDLFPAARPVRPDEENALGKSSSGIVGGCPS